jgi:hypothetical protein
LELPLAEKRRVTFKKRGFPLSRAFSSEIEKHETRKTEKNMFKKSLLILTLFGAAVLAGCVDDDDGSLGTAAMNGFVQGLGNTPAANTQQYSVLQGEVDTLNQIQAANADQALAHSMATHALTHSQGKSFFFGHSHKSN